MCNACAYTRALVEILWHFLQILFPFSKKKTKKNEPPLLFLPTTKTLLLLKEETQRGEGEEYER